MRTVKSPVNSSSNESSDSGSEKSDKSNEEDGGSPPQDGGEGAQPIDLEQVNKELGGAIGSKSVRPKFVRPAERRQFDAAVKKETRLIELLEQIAEFLEFGSPVYVITSEPAPVITKRHMFLAKGRKAICFCEFKPDGSPDKAKTTEVLKIADISGILLGQFSDVFAKALEGAPMVPRGTPMPETAAKITLSSLPIFFYRSFSLEAKKSTLLDVVADSDTDFEAWVVTVHRLTLKDPAWGAPLDISTVKDVARLNDEEKKLCAVNHITPTSFLQAKNAILHKDPRLYYTILDIRTISTLDLCHSQKLMEFLFKLHYLERVMVFHVRYLEAKRAEDDQRKKNDEINELRERIIAMVQKYVATPMVAIEEYLKTIVGKEKETLDELIRQHGPEPPRGKPVETSKVPKNEK